MKTEIETYHKSGKTYLELHSNRTAWKFKSPKGFEDEEIDLQFEIDYLLAESAESFKITSGVEVFLLGRSRRHVCVEDNAENRKRYSELQSLALSMEKKYVADVNRLIYFAIKTNPVPYIPGNNIEKIIEKLNVFGFCRVLIGQTTLDLQYDYDFDNDIHQTLLKKDNKTLTWNDDIDMVLTFATGYAMATDTIRGLI